MKLGLVAGTAMLVGTLIGGGNANANHATTNATRTEIIVKKAAPTRARMTMSR